VAFFKRESVMTDFAHIQANNPATIAMDMENTNIAN
jgi:hypothetical protein